MLDKVEQLLFFLLKNLRVVSGAIFKYLRRLVDFIDPGGFIVVFVISWFHHGINLDGRIVGKARKRKGPSNILGAGTDALCEERIVLFTILGKSRVAK
jgi:hypothetical protein